MENKLILQPNWHSEIYRTLTPKLDVTTLYKYLDFIEVSEDGHVLLGSSNLTGRTWFGSVWYYETIDLCINSNLTTYVANKSNLNGGLVNGKFIKNDSSKMIIIDDSGCIQVLSLPENGDEPDDKLQLHKLSEEHESIITDIALFKTNQTQFITCSMDLSIKIWDLEHTRVESNEYLNSLVTYSSAHTDTITSIDTHLTNNNLLVSCSLDHHVLLWDDRCNNTGTGTGTGTNNNTKDISKSIYLNEFNGLTNVKWYPSPTYDYLLNVSSECGDLYTIDIRNCNNYLYKLTNIFNDQTSIYRMCYNYKNNYLSVCGDASQVIVYDTMHLNQQQLDQTNIIYMNDNKHQDYVRGLAWSNSNANVDDSSAVLLTCGWDQKIYKHCILKSK